MDFGFTEEQEKLRKEVHGFFINELPRNYRAILFGVTAVCDEFAAFLQELQKKAGQRGWLAPSWPTVYGGLGVDEIERGIIKEESRRWMRAWPDYTGVELGGPTLLLFGNEEQKKRYLPAVGWGEAQWEELFTEPNAGSDVANIQLRAVSEGDDFIFNGQKMFVGEASYKPDYLFTLARTADATPKHRGLTLFLIPGDTPGISWRPLPVMNGQTKKEIFFDDVRVSKGCLIGELNRGFYYAVAVLRLERAFLGNPARERRELEEFVQFCKETRRNGKIIMEEPQIRDQLAKMAVELEVCRLASWCTVWKVSQEEKRGPLDYDLSYHYLRIFATSRYEAMMDILGLYGQLRCGSKWAPMAGMVERNWQGARSYHGGGTTEIVKNVIAERGLGLPRR